MRPLARFAASVAIALSATLAAARPIDFKTLSDQRSPALVSIKFILDVQGQEQEQEVTGVMITADGLVLTSNIPFGGMARLMGAENTFTPKDIKVLVGDDTQGVEAKLISRDSELSLAWIKIDKAPDSPYAFVDFADNAEAKLGDSLLIVRRMNKFFDRASYVAEARVAGLIAKPRTMIVPSNGFRIQDFGLPVFGSDGKLIGASTILIPEGDEASGTDLREIFSDAPGGLILPAKEVVDATQRALEAAATNPIPSADAQPAQAPEVAPVAAPEPTPAPAPTTPKP